MQLKDKNKDYIVYLSEKLMSDAEKTNKRNYIIIKVLLKLQAEHGDSSKLKASNSS
jgi:hypothetical protein